MEGRQLLTTLAALTSPSQQPNVANQIALFDSDSPGTILKRLDVTGLVGGDNLNSIDVRPSNQKLYATALRLLTATTSELHLYEIDLTATAAVAHPLPGSVPLDTGATRVGTDFDPSTDQLRVVTRGNAAHPGGRNFTINPDTGSLAAAGTDLAYLLTIPGSPPPAVRSLASADLGHGAVTFGVDQNTLKLATIGDDPALPPTLGTIYRGPDLGIVEPRGLAFFPPAGQVDEAGFDIAPDGTAYFGIAQAESNGTFTTFLHQLDLQVGTISHGFGEIKLGGDPVQDLAVLPAAIDVIPPTVSPSVQVIFTGRGSRTKVSGFQLTYSEDMDGNRVQDLNNYLVQLAPASRRGRFHTLRLASATYHANAQTLTLKLASPSKLTRKVRINVSGHTPNGLTDLAGNLLDGNRDSLSGGDAILTANPRRR
jgi:hypothetical protein